MPKTTISAPFKIAIASALVCSLFTPAGAKQLSCGLAGSVPPRVAALAFGIAGNHDAAITADPKEPSVSGIAAYLTKDYQTALSDFAEAAKLADQEAKPRLRKDELAAAGFWGAKALDALNRSAEAAQLRDLAVEQRGTFYALLIDPQNGLPQYGSYPTLVASYRDPRADQILTWAITREESGFDAKAASSAGAHGAMQVIDQTASRIAKSVNMPLDRKRLRTDFDYNTAIGSTFLGWLLQRYDNYPPLAIAAYNAGEACVDQWIQALGDPRKNVDPILWIEAIPFQETRLYVQHVLASYMKYQSISQSAAAKAP